MGNETTESVVLQSIRNLMETMKLTADQVMRSFKISDRDKTKYLEKI